MTASYSRPQSRPAVAATAIVLLATLFMSFAFTVVSLWAGAVPGKFIFPAAVTMAVITGLWAVPQSRQGLRPVAVVLSSLAIIAVSVTIGAFTIDYSYDGLYYHQEMIAAILDGWNPFNQSLPYGDELSIWTLHYAKSVELSAASIVAMTGSIESGKAVNLIAIISTGCGIYSWLSSRGGNLARYRLVLTLAAVANPVSIQQMLTYCMDFYKYIYAIFFLLSLYDIIVTRDNRRGCTVLSMTLILAMATKFNMFFEAGIWMAAALIWVALHRDKSAFVRILLTGVAALAAGAVLTYHPYITNWISAGHPLFPLMGEGAEDIMTSNTPPQFVGHNRFVTFLLSIFSVTFPAVSQPIGGFTPFMPLILLLSLWLAVRLVGHVSSTVVYILAVTLISCFFFEQAWWARYICQLWLIPVILTGACIKVHVAQIVSRVTSWLMIAAGAFTIAYAAKQLAVVGLWQKCLLEAAAADGEITVSGEEIEWGPQFARHFAESGATFNHVDSIPADTPDTVNFYFHEYRAPIVRVSAGSAGEIRKTFEKLHLNYQRHIVGSEESIEYLATHNE